MLKRNTDMIIKLLLIVAFIVLLLFILSMTESRTDGICLRASTKESESQKEALIEDPVLYSELSYSVYYDPDATKEFLAKIQTSIIELNCLNESDYTLKAWELTQQERTRLVDLEAKVASDLTHYLTWETEYYYATKTWEYLMQRGYSREITSAIIGNMMVETSGGTLKLKPNIYSPSKNYYGLCQWSLKYYPGTKDLPFEHQLDYLTGNMPWEFNTFGGLYQEGFTYEDFLVLEDVNEAALVFAQVYERCGPESFKLRQEAAVKAYNYFDLNT